MKQRRSNRARFEEIAIERGYEKDVAAGKVVTLESDDRIDAFFAEPVKRLENRGDRPSTKSEIHTSILAKDVGDLGAHIIHGRAAQHHERPGGATVLSRERDKCCYKAWTAI